MTNPHLTLLTNKSATLFDAELFENANKLEKLDKTTSLDFAIAIRELALAKNIKILDGTLEAWERCLIEDLQANWFEFSDFLLAVKKIIRKPAYGRLDYSDMYQEAVELCYERKSTQLLDCPFCGRKNLYTMKDIYENCHKACKCDSSWSEIRSYVRNNDPYWPRYQQLRKNKK